MRRLIFMFLVLLVELGGLGRGFVSLDGLEKGLGYSEWEWECAFLKLCII